MLSRHRFSTSAVRWWLQTFVAKVASDMTSGKVFYGIPGVFAGGIPKPTDTKVYVPFSRVRSMISSITGSCLYTVPIVDFLCPYSSPDIFDDTSLLGERE